MTTICSAWITTLLWKRYLIKDITNSYNCFLKNANFSVKTTNDQITSCMIKKPIYCCFGWHNLFFYTILRSFTVSIKKKIFRSFLSQVKRYKGLTGRCYCRCNYCSFIYRILSQCFEILIFSKDIWGNVHYVNEISPTSPFSDNSLLSAEQNK